MRGEERSSIESTIEWKRRGRNRTEREKKKKKERKNSNRSNRLHNIFLEEELAGRGKSWAQRRKKKWKGSRTNCGNKLISGGR